MTAVHPAVRTALGAFVACVYLAGAVLLTRTSPYAPLAFAALLVAPLLLYGALVRPLVFPFGLYVVLVPFDNLLGEGQFGTLTKLLGIVAGAFLLIWLVRRNSIVLRGRPIAVLGLLAVWMVLTTAWALDQQASLLILATYGGLMLLYGALCMTPVARSQLDTLLAIVGIGGLAAAVYGAYLFYTNPMLAVNAANARLIVATATTRIDPNHFAAALLFPAAIFAMWTLRARRLTTKCVAIAALGMVALAIVLSGSRGAFLSLALMLIYFMLRSPRRIQLIAVLSVVGVVLAGAQTSMWTRFAKALETGGSGRTSIWSVGLEALKHRPIQGYGIGNFQQAYDLFYLSVRQTYPYGFSSPAHSLIVHYGVELGIVGLLLLGWFFVAQAQSLAKIKRDHPLYDYRIAMEGALLAIAAMSLTIDLFTYKYAWLVFATVALLANAGRASYASAEMRSARASMTPARSVRAASR